MEEEEGTEVRNIMSCIDCGVNTGRAGIREYYHVHDEVWENAFQGTRTHGYGDDDFLCIGCLEGRMGRELKPGDFSDAPINNSQFVTVHWGLELSDRMKERTGQK